ncbi:MAG TPA: OFA family MFS transporter [Methylophilus sp.]|nr:OFA family MFS transporter [Methylophilus sp.]HQQ33795.1 OFA family MFS transporter [Methylophilus sp.]
MHKGRAVAVVAAALGINLIIGVLYAWSIFKDAILESIHSGAADGFHWAASSVNDPYALCCLIFAFTMIPAGRFQDIYGPRKASMLGAVLGGLGFMMIANSVNYWVWMIGFGGLVGAGIGFAYASTTPAALKWFAHTKSGLITGIVVSGFALASVYIAPLATHLVLGSGLKSTMLFFSAQFFVLISVFAYFLTKPPEGHVPIGHVERRQRDNHPIRDVFAKLEADIADPLHVLKQSQFWLLWTLLFLGAGAGLMVIGNIKPLAKLSMGDLAYIAIVILAVGDATGRILAGTLSTRFGRRKVLSVAFFIQMLLMFSTYAASVSGSALLIMFVATFIGINYGANLVLFPNYVKDFWGMRHFGMIYGMLFSSWGVGGFVMVKLSEFLMHRTGNSHTSFTVAGGLIMFGWVLTFFVDNRKDKERLALRKQHQAEAEMELAEA